MANSYAGVGSSPQKLDSYLPHLFLHILSLLYLPRKNIAASN
ncbi:protein of unknown function [Paraburkholderia dioscoreae]|uniref:Uncharacterized protein n=1 Tax=Paraburkholderia dioscoreae TaxID=2604047 RepID=A0A5Q4Z3U6_9BURK|nr:protein of unknown function [Paraburkholderia dioscoreae]